MPAPFSRSPGAFWDEYQSWQNEVENAFIRARGPANRASYNATLATSLSNSDMLNALPYKERKRMLESFRTSILGLNTGYMDDFFNPVGPGGNDMMVGRFVSTAEDSATNPLAYLLRRMSIQQSTDPTVGAADRYTVSGNIPRAQHLRAMKERGSLHLAAGSTVTVFDTETLGLATDAGTVREISAVNMVHRGGRLEVDTANMYTKHLKVGRSAFGSLWDKATGATVRMDDYIRNKLAKGTALDNPLNGRVFVESVMPLLQQMSQADYIAGHNVGFDISQVVGNVMRTSDYLNNRIVGEVGVRDAVGQVLNKIKRGEVIDTMEMVTEYFNNQLDLAPEYSALKSPRPFSLENIMLQTNMVDLMRNDKDLGPKFINKIIMEGQHQADVDTVITAKLIDYVSTGRLSPSKLGGGGRIVDLMLRKKILSSYAPTPVSNISDISDISPTNFSRLYDEAMGGKNDVLNVFSLLSGDRAPLGAAGADDWYKYLTDDTNLTHFGSVKFTLMEQHVLDQRNLGMATDEFAGINNLGQWNRYAGYSQTGGGFLNRLQTIFKRANIPDDETFTAFQQRMAKSGMPFAGLSLEERILTGAMSSAAREKSTINKLLAGTAEGRLAEVGDDLGISRFAMRENFYTQGSVASIPLDVIRRAEADQVLKTAFTKGDELQMLSLSTIESSREINLSMDIKKKEAQALVSWLEESMATDAPDQELKTMLRSRGLNAPVLEDLKSMLDEGTLVERGINVGYLDDSAGRQGYEVMKNLLQDLTRDKDKIPFRVGFLSAGAADKETGQGIIRTGAVILDRFLTKEDKAAYRTNLDLAQARANTAMNDLPDRLSGLKAKLGYATGGVDDITKRADALYGAIKGKGPKIAGAAALVFGGYYAYKKHKQQNVYDESMENMGYETQNDYDRYRGEMGMPTAPASRRMDPLLTAGVVGNLDRNAIGHTQMGPQKHMNLFSGV